MIKSSRQALLWLSLASLFFYGYWNPKYLLLLAGSVLANYLIGLKIRSLSGQRSQAKLLATLGIVLNLGLIGYYKYAGFFVEEIAAIVNQDWSVDSIILPLAISFFTFQQIAYLVDCFQNKVKSHSFLEYLIFVTFFPQLIAGPIVHQADMLSQFRSANSHRRNIDFLATGITIFALGLFKKVIIADNLSAFATPLFSEAMDGTILSFAEAWTAALSWTFQLYFDFSGYSDMAIGLALMFGIVLPVNFASPYKATSIIEFWRCWHITLSNFLRDYLYIPLGGNRNGQLARYRNLGLTMLLGGLWHGAGWTYVIWGGLHGLYLTINHLWRALPFYKTIQTLPLLSLIHI